MNVLTYFKVIKLMKFTHDPKYAQVETLLEYCFHIAQKVLD